MLGRGEVPHADLVARSSLRSWLTAREAPEIDAALLAAAEAAARDAPAQEEWDLRGYSAGAVRFDDPCLVGVPPERAAASAAAGARSLVLTSSTSLARLPVAPLRRLVAEQLAKAGPLAVQLEMGSSTGTGSGTGGTEAAAGRGRTRNNTWSRREEDAND